MITITIDKSKIDHLAKNLSEKQVQRIMEQAIDKTARAVKEEIKSQLPRIFDRPTPFTMNSLQLTLTQNHNMKATVWFKEPKGHQDHYLVPQVESGPRRFKGFERALSFTKTFLPSKYSKLDKYGNLPYGVIGQFLSVLKLSAQIGGNITERSKKKNRKPRDYVLFNEQHGRLPPGVYQRVQTNVGFGYKTKKTLPFGEWQQGRKKGRFASVIRARGLRPIVIARRHPFYGKRFPFHQIGQKVVNERFNGFFIEAMHEMGLR